MSDALLAAGLVVPLRLVIPSLSGRIRVHLLI
jgi:hypothetical protein